MLVEHIPLYDFVVTVDLDRTFFPGGILFLLFLKRPFAVISVSSI